MLHWTLMVVHFLVAFCIVGLVLLQRGKGAEAGAGFGAGASGTVFGARGASTALSRATAVFAGIFMVTSLMLVYESAHRKVSHTGTVLEQLKPTTTTSPPSVAPAAPVVPATPATTSPASPVNTPTNPAGH